MADSALNAPTARQTEDAVATVALVSLGCPKNLVDSESMLGQLAEAGLTPIADEADADAIVINTCGFLEASKQESLDEIARAVEHKRAGRCRRVIVAGCLVQRHRARLLEWAPEVDALVGVFDRDRIVAAVRGPRAEPRRDDHPLPVYSSIAASALAARAERGLDAAGYHEVETSRLRLTPRHYAYLRISEGCNQNCAFCTIPSIRGKMRSKPVDAMIAEARELVADGAFELNLIGQDTTSYGRDLADAGAPGGDQGGLVGMLQSLDRYAAGEGGLWLRLMYAYPSQFTDAMIDAIGRLPSVLPYIDMPLQHIDDQILDAMRRRTSRDLITRLLDKLRDRVPGIAIRTTFISGFPGETEAQHESLRQFIEHQQFEAVGVFPYSPEPNTPAARLHAEGGAVPDEIIQRRIEELMLTQQAVVLQRNERLTDEAWETDLLIDGPADVELESDDPADAGLALYVGRSSRQAPQVDSVTYVMSRRELAPGELLRCRIVGWDDYDLMARPVEQMQRTTSLPVLGVGQG